MVLTLLKEDENIREYRLTSGEKIKIEIDEWSYEVKVTNSNDKEIGRIEFKYDDYEDAHKIIWMYLDKLGDNYKRQGIGKECVKFYKEFFDCRVYAEQNDGIRKDDGSHLTGDAPGFVQSLRDQGIIEL